MAEICGKLGEALGADVVEFGAGARVGALRRLRRSQAAVGIAQACLDEGVKYAREREQFGRPIGKFQAIQWMLADMATEVSASRSLVLRASFLKDKG